MHVFLKLRTALKEFKVGVALGAMAQLAKCLAAEADEPKQAGSTRRRNARTLTVS